jgi:DNA-binding transcriptional regulator YiaG
MANLSQAIKAEIVRISRKEIKSSIGPLHSSNVALKHAVAGLKRRVAELESSNRQLMASYKKEKGTPQITTEEVQKARITSRTIRKLREKLGVSQESFAKLIGISSQNIYVMEHKAGRLRLRPSTLTSLLTVRGMGKRDVQKRLEAERPSGKK